MRMPRCKGLLLVAVVALSCSVGIGQTSAQAPVFDVVSIKPSGQPPGNYSWGINPAGNIYSTNNAPVMRVILDVYFVKSNEKHPERVKGAPAWAISDGYTIKAKVDDATAEAWKSLGMARTQVLVAPLLKKKMLEERFKLVAHVDTMDVQGFALVVTKDGPKLKEAKPGEKPRDDMRELPSGGKVHIDPPNGGTRIATFQMTMGQFVDYFSQSGVTLVDQTGLTGMYDFKVPVVPIDTLNVMAPDGDPWKLDASERLRLWNLKAVGLEWKPVKVRVQTVVVDHIERPTEN